MKRIISLLLSLVLAAGAISLISCTMEDNEYVGGEIHDTDTTPTDTTTAVIKLPQPIIVPVEKYPITRPGTSLPDFDGKKVRFALSSAILGDNENDGYRACDVEQTNGDIINEAVYSRNKRVEQLINVEIEVALCTDEKSFTSTVTPYLLAGDDDFDWMWANQSYDVDLCTQGFVLDLNKIDNDINYIDANAQWWASSYMAQSQYKDELFWLSGPLSLIYAGGLSCVFVNEDLYNKYIIQNYGSIYDIVRAGEWTIGTFAKMSNDVYNESGKSVMGSRMADQQRVMQLLVGAGLEYTTKNADGTISLDIVCENSKYTAISKTVSDLFESIDGISGLYEFGNTFVNSNQLFCYGDIAMAKQFVEMEHGFLIVPSPKLDNKQDHYRTSVTSQNQIMGLAYTCNDIGAATATLEMMAYYAYSEVLFTYYDRTLKYKYSRDDGAADMIHLILDSVYTDFGIVWDRQICGNDWVNRDGYTSASTTPHKNKKDWQQSFDNIKKLLDQRISEPW